MLEFDWLKTQLAAISEYVSAQYQRRDTVRVDTKRDATDLLTEVDLAVQQRLSDAIADRFPDDAIVAEEAGRHAYPDDPDGRCWVIDPIDGTQNFVRGFFPIFGISAAFVEHGRPRCGIVAVPVPGWWFEAVEGRGATCNGLPLRVSGVDRIADARVETDFGALPKRPVSLARFEGLLRESGALRCYGSAALGLCGVASGDTDAYANVGLAPWDYAAGALIVAEAGGQATRPDGQAIHLFSDDQGIIATNGRLHAESIALIGA